MITILCKGGDEDEDKDEDLKKILYQLHVME